MNPPKVIRRVSLSPKLSRRKFRKSEIAEYRLARRPMEGVERECAAGAKQPLQKQEDI